MTASTALLAKSVPRRPGGSPSCSAGNALRCHPRACWWAGPCPPWRDVAAVRALTQVSRTTQARLFWQADTLYVNDAGSSNRTFVDGVRLTSPVPLRPGAALRFGLDVDVGVVELDEYGMVKETEGDDAFPSA